MTWQEAGLLSDDLDIAATLRWAASRNANMDVLRTIKYRMETTQEADSEFVRENLGYFVAAQ